MAHRTNVIQVPENIEADESKKMVVDPVCGKEIERLKAPSVVYRPEGTFYFCSRECKEKFLNRKAA